MFSPCVVCLAVQVNELRGGMDILIGTPGRLLELVESRRIVLLSRLRYLVVDEADKMLDLNLEPTLRRLVGGQDFWWRCKTCV